MLVEGTPEGGEILGGYHEGEVRKITVGAKGIEQVVVERSSDQLVSSPKTCPLMVKKYLGPDVDAALKWRISSMQRASPGRERPCLCAAA